MTAEDFFESEDNPINEIDKKGAWFGYSQLLQFAEAYADTHARQMAVEFGLDGLKALLENEKDLIAYREKLESDYDTFTASTDRKEDKG